MGGTKKKAQDTAKKVGDKVRSKDPVKDKKHKERVKIAQREAINGPSAKGYHKFWNQEIEAERNKKRDAKRKKLDKEYGPDLKKIAATVGKQDFNAMSDKHGNLLNRYKLGDANPWLKLQQEQLGLQTQSQLDNATQSALGQRAGAETALAARGGMDSGARERLMSDQMRNVNLQQQGVRGTAEMNRLGLESDAFDKNQAVDQVNLQTLIQDNQNKNLYQANKYNENMRAWAANKQAKATEKSGGSGGAFGTVLCTLIYDFGYIPREILEAGHAFGKKVVGEKNLNYYRAWAYPLSKLCRRHPALVAIIAPVVKAWSYEMAHRMGAHPKSNLLGRLLLKFALPVSNCVGKALNFSKLNFNQLPVKGR